jgi:hypothetical protein
MMKSISTKPDAKLTKEQQEFQKDVFLTWKILEKYANALGNLISFTKIDTRKQGKTFIQMMAYLNGY